MDGLRAFVTDRKVLARNCDERTCFRTENLDGDGKSRHTNTLNPFGYLN